jgi:methionyl-tRNA synthetase
MLDVSDQNFYLTTTLPYVNAKPHIGFALEIVAGDVITRYQRDILDKKVVFNTGTDEHGQKIYQEALKANQDPQTYTDEYAAKFENLKKLLNLDYTHFIRTTNPDHKKAAQEFWKRCDANGYIYQKDYAVKYCVGCELEKTESELVDDRCLLHPNQELETRQEENYFFKFSKFQQPLLDLYKDNSEFVKPDSKMKEITAFVKSGLKDFSISRLKEKMPWGVPVPDDDQHVMYVWFDALINYISTLGWPDESKSSKYSQFWPGVQLAGKDNLRQQSAMWQAMLLAAKLPPSKQILINGFISVGGQKMSKSLGNVISPTEMVDRYGLDATRYLLINLGPFGADMDVTWEKLDAVYAAELANGIGNLCSRVATLCEKTDFINKTSEIDLPTDYQQAMQDFDLLAGLQATQSLVAKLDQYLAKEKPWELASKQAHPILKKAVGKINLIGKTLLPFMPETSQIISDYFNQEKITKIQPLFPRLEN